MTIIDLSGQKFGRLSVIGMSDKFSNAGKSWIAQCDCGNITTVNSLKLRKGLIVSCGCYRKEINKVGLNLKHGMSKNNAGTAYRTWKEMRQRCLNPNSDKWQWYGGRGIGICARWDNFELFLQDMGARPNGCSLDRINPDGNYEPGNCRWATPKMQAESNRGCFKKGENSHRAA